MASSQFQVPSSNTTSTVTTTNCSQGEAASTHPLTRFTTTTLLSSSPKNGQITGEQKTKIEEKLLSGQYSTLKEMASDINEGVPSKAIEETIFNNMMKIMLKKLNE